jgi:hypothetical protein
MMTPVLILTALLCRSQAHLRASSKARYARAKISAGYEAVAVPDTLGDACDLYVPKGFRLVRSMRHGTSFRFADGQGSSLTVMMGVGAESALKEFLAGAKREFPARGPKKHRKRGYMEYWAEGAAAPSSRVPHPHTFGYLLWARSNPLRVMTMTLVTYGRPKAVLAVVSGMGDRIRVRPKG